MDEFNEIRFNQQVSAALASVRRVLDTTRNPDLPSAVQHTYNDKYYLVSCLTNSALAALLYCFTELGVTPAHLKTLKAWSATRAVTLRFSAERRCTFDREVKRDVDSATKSVTETSVFGNFTSKTVTTIHEFFWKFDADWELSAYAGTAAAESIVLSSRKAHHELMTNSKTTPQPTVFVNPPIEVNITWFLQQLTADGKLSFQIDRSVTTCHTPRRNASIDKAIDEFTDINAFTSTVQQYFISQLFPIQTGHGLDLSALHNAATVFVPVVPLFEKGNHKRKIEEEKGVVIHAGPPADSACLSLTDMGQFLNEQRRSMVEKFEALTATFPAKGALISLQEAKVVVVLLHSNQVIHAYKDSVDYVEVMLHRQLIAAIGKEVRPVDFSEYMMFHSRKLFKPEYQPKGFCYAIRRPEHYPEGTLSLESDDTPANIMEPIQTTVRSSVATTPMYFSINAATKIAFFGDRHLHGCVLHRFSDQTSPNMSLTCRARQFSSFILLVGTIQSKDEFKPTYGTIIQNKDELVIPLLLETLPTPKEFADAIESLSPEQQRFCKAFRSMQLASTLFGVCIIQIKPQLEKLLNIPNDSLTKEIRLTQDLMELFIKYQIPSDLLSYEGAEAVDLATKIGQVKRNVAALQDMIQSSKQAELKQAAEAKVHEVLSVTAVPEMYYLDDGVPQKKEMRKSKKSGGVLSKMFNRRSEFSAFEAPMECDFPEASFEAITASPAADSVVSAEPAPPADPGQPPAEPAPGQPDQPKQPLEAKVVSTAEDFTALPGALDARISNLDSDHALRSTIIKPGTAWTKHFQKGLLSKPSVMGMGEMEQKNDKNAAFDLLDALSRSGVLSIDQASLHVVLMATHCFDKTLVETVIQDNVNPIEKVERSALILASVVHNAPPLELVHAEQRPRVELYSPSLLGAE